MKFGLVVVMAGALVARPATACVSASLRDGLTVVQVTLERTIAADGVVGFDAYSLGSTPAQALEQFAVELALDGAPVAGSLAVVELWTGEYELAQGPVRGLPVYQFIVVWRPDQPLAAGVYTGETRLTVRPDVVEAQPLTITVGDEPGPALAGVDAPQLVVEEQIDEVYERACCESTGTSCGDLPYCQATQVHHASVLVFDAQLSAAQSERAYLWVAPVVDGVVGARVATHLPYYDVSSRQWPIWSGWSRSVAVRFGAASEQCVVLGATSLIDGSEVMAPTVCATLPPGRDESRMPTFKPADFDMPGGECLSPPVYEHSGEPYAGYDDGQPAAEQGGCRVGGGPAGLLVIVGLVARRRRRQRLQRRA